MFVKKIVLKLLTILHLQSQAGAYILEGLTPSGLRGTLGSNALNPYVSEGQGIGVELVTVFMLVFVVLAITDEKREGKVVSD